MKTVYYFPVEYGVNIGELDGVLKHPVADPKFGLPITSVLSETDRRHTWSSSCPAWKHRAQRTFTVRSNIDLTIDLDLSDLDETGQVSIDTPGLRRKQHDAVLRPTFSSRWLLRDPDIITLQLATPRIMLWTEDKDVWVEQRAHPTASVRNNIVLVEAWFNLSAWTRHLSFGFTVFDNDKPVIIKRGDPVYQFVIHTKDKNERVRLIRKEPSEKVMLEMNRNSGLKHWWKGGSKNFIFGQQEKQSKCPFSFLWNK